jgi:outer membrane protein OmpA-like peptidoglycan-associated protein
MLEGNVSKHLGVNLEVSANNLHDRFNPKQNGRGDWQLTAMVGLTYKFGFKKRKVEAPAVVVPEPVMETPVAPAPAPVVEEVVEEPKVEVVEEPAPAVVEEPAPAPAPEELAENIYFNINSAEITAEEEAKVKALSQWLESHPSAVVEVTGYADAGTGNADINMKISKKRAAAVAAQLSKKYGIPANRIKVSAKGDTIQPLTVNDKNRVVITYAKEQK